MKPGGLVEFLENALRPHLPAPAPRRSMPSLSDGLYAVGEIARRRLTDRGFLFLMARANPHRATIIAEARHECGSILCVEVAEASLVLSPGSFIDTVTAALDAAGCYCVRPYVAVPCTAQRCAP